MSIFFSSSFMETALNVLFKLAPLEIMQMKCHFQYWFSGKYFKLFLANSGFSWDKTSENWHQCSWGPDIRKQYLYFSSDDSFPVHALRLNIKPILCDKDVLASWQIHVHRNYFSISSFIFFLHLSVLWQESTYPEDHFWIVSKVFGIVKILLYRFDYPLDSILVRKKAKTTERKKETLIQSFAGAKKKGDLWYQCSAKKCKELLLSVKGFLSSKQHQTMTKRCYNNHRCH